MTWVAERMISASPGHDLDELTGLRPSRTSTTWPSSRSCWSPPSAIFSVTRMRAIAPRCGPARPPPRSTNLTSRGRALKGMTTTTRTPSCPPHGSLVLHREAMPRRIGFAARTPVDPPWRRDDPAFAEGAARQLAEYFAGERRAFDLPLAPAGTVPAPGVGRAGPTPLRGRATPAWPSGSAGPAAPGRGRRQRGQPAGHRRALPPGGGRRRHPHRLRRRAAAKRAYWRLEGHRFSTGTGSMPSLAGVANPNTWA